MMLDNKNEQKWPLTEKEVLKKDQPIAYTGYEPSGKIHLGHAVSTC